MNGLEVFLIEDDIDDQEIFLTALEGVDTGFICKTAFNGQDAISRLLSKEVSPDVIFLDLNMPLMNGKDFLARIRATGDYKDIPIYVLTTTSNQHTAREVKALGANDMITKPSSFSELRNLLKTILDRL
jgi:CheY-like chemotaxis protein